MYESDMPKVGRNQHIMVIVGIVLVVVIGGFVLTNRLNKFTELPEPQPQAEEMRQALLGLSSLAFTSNNPLTLIFMEELPPDLRTLIPRNAESVIIKKGTQENGAEIYKISFVLESGIFDSFRAMQTIVEVQERWNISSASRANMFAVIDAYKTSHILQSTMNLLSDSRTEIIINIGKQ
jgi:hypothetical protein